MICSFLKGGLAMLARTVDTKVTCGIDLLALRDGPDDALRGLPACPTHA